MNQPVNTQAKKPPWLFGRRRWVLEHQLADLRLALEEVMEFVGTELDPSGPYPWEAYATSPRSQRALRILQGAKYLEDADA